MSKRNVRLDRQLWSFIAWRLKRYREDKKALERYQNRMVAPAIAKYGVEPSGHTSETGRPTENLVVLDSTNPYIRTLETTTKAIDTVMGKLSEMDQKLIDLVYCTGTHTVSGAALVVHVSTRTAYRHIDRIFLELAVGMGLISSKHEKDDTF